MGLRPDHSAKSGRSPNRFTLSEDVIKEIPTRERFWQFAVEFVAMIESCKSALVVSPSSRNST